MTFEEWYNTAPLVLNAEDAFRACWNAAYSQGRQSVLFEERDRQTYALDIEYCRD